MGRRSKNAVSLFAFQDVMAGVIGALFFVVLTMSLDIVNQPSAHSADLAPDRQQAERDLQHELASLEERKRTLEAALAQSAETLKAVAKYTEPELIHRIEQQDRALRAVHASIQSAQARLADLHGQHQAAALREKDNQDVMAELDAAIDTARQDLEAQKASPRIAFILDRADDDKKAWLLEVSDRRFRAASHDGVSTVLAFTEARAERRTRQLLQWVAQQNPNECFFVLLIKPSGAGLAGELADTLRRKGFEIGDDLLPEDWNPFGIEDMP